MELNSKNIKKIILIIALGAIIFTALQNLQSVMVFLGNVVSVFSPVIAALCVAFVLNVLLSALENNVFKFMDKSKKKFIHKLKCRLGKINIERVDERLTTVQAHKTMNLLNVDKKKKKNIVDTISAVYILETYINKLN